MILPHNIPKLIVKRTIETDEIEIDYKSNIPIKRTWYSSARENRVWFFSVYIILYTLAFKTSVVCFFFMSNVHLFPSSQEF